ncbi:molybdopterin-dependent oxidoreductase [Candidatus Acetothermia bacterium]|nr:molybdopterin-dependent oxidoreductase [Candidatus Acetothermia bacterium]
MLLISLTGTSIDWSWGALIAAAAGTAALYLVLLRSFDLLLRVTSAKSSEPSDATDSRYTRRDLLATLVSTAGAALMWPLLAHDLSEQGSTSSDSLKSSVQMTLPPLSRFDSIPGLPSRVTPVGQFYYVSKNLLPHQASVWGPLCIEGLVEHTLTLSLRDLQTLPSIEHFVTLVCVDYEPNNPRTNDLISTALWRGVSLQTLIAQAGVRPEATTLELYATDGYSTAIPLRLILENPATLLAYRMNGQPLDARHGIPLRLISPGLYGFKNIKHLHRIILSKGEYSGYWERRGWAQQAPVKLLSKITTPEADSRLARNMPIWIAGIAFAGQDGISTVEISVDGGQRWKLAELEEPLSPFSWTRWAYQWVPSQTGSFVLTARATDGHGRPQDYAETSAFPAGATGYHSVLVQVN